VKQDTSPLLRRHFASSSLPVTNGECGVDDVMYEAFVILSCYLVLLSCLVVLSWRRLGTTLRCAQGRLHHTKYCEVLWEKCPGVEPENTLPVKAPAHTPTLHSIVRRVSTHARRRNPPFWAQTPSWAVRLALPSARRRDATSSLEGRLRH